MSSPTAPSSSPSVGSSTKVSDQDIPTLNKVINNTTSAVNMASTYFTLPSFTRAKRNQEELRKSNPQVPILKDEDEKFLERSISQDTSGVQAKSTDAPPTVISDSGEVKEAESSDIKAAASDDQVVVPETRLDTAEKDSGDAGDTQPKKTKKKKDFDLPSQEEAEAATRNWDAAFAKNSSSKDSSGDKRTWASYLPSIPAVGKKEDKAPATDDAKKGEDAATDAKAEDKTPATDGATTPGRTWTEYATSYVPASLPTLPTLPTIPRKWNFKSKDKDSQFQPVHNPDGSINEKETKDQQEKEITILLDQMSATTLNDRVFALNAQTQKIYEDFALALRDTINGTPTAYQDMEKLMREAGPRLEEQFKALPPFMQTLVKSLPAKLGTVLAPELLAVAADKPGADLKAQQASSSSRTASPPRGTAKSKAKSKRKVPGLKSLIGQQGAVAGILRNVVKFMQVRFPFLASATNVVMSLSVFVLMFVFWYCHKRGKEIRLEQERIVEVEDDEAEDDDDDDDDEGESSEDDKVDLAATDAAAAEEKLGEVAAKVGEPAKQPEPAQVPLPA